ncbi:MAG: peptidoglycan DD-metalloendopeptidase family protein [Saprospiraceae bacterium]|nr:peptidoglycan DD-metalloendopeptidase family protein [Saprospiraceae bacterium]
MIHSNPPFPVLGNSLNPEHFQLLDLSSANKQLTQIGLVKYIDEYLSKNKIGYGGYLENRTFYLDSKLFSENLRTLHLGIDLWTNAGTPMYCPWDGVVHSFADNGNYLDYGPTIILEHNSIFGRIYSLYGHLSRESLIGLYEGKPFSRGSQIATLGHVGENGNWPPHLHLQLIRDMEANYGDFPGVVEPDKKDIYTKLCPNPLALIGLS